MGCASSTPMIQTTGSEMLKAATHVATDATKTAEDAVEGIKDSVGKTLETAKDSVATTVESVKHEVENVVKQKSEMVGDATNSLMEKLHLKQTEHKTEEIENSKHSNGVNDALAEHTEATKGIKEHVIAATDTETDSLRTTTPEPEIEQALAKSRNSQGDEKDNPPTPKPTLAELENLSAEVFQQGQQQDGLTIVNDITMSNDLLMSGMHENIKTADSNNMMSLNVDNNTIKDNQLTTALTKNNDDIKSTTVHKTPQTNFSPNPQTPLLPLTLATNAIAKATAGVATAPSENVEEKINLKKSKVHKEEEKVVNKIDPTCEEKRPKTTEWEKFADLLAQIRKFNPQDAYRRGGTHTKLGGQLRERPLLGHHMRNGMNDDGSDTTSNFPPSPQSSPRSSARQVGKVQRLPNRPTTTGNADGNYAHKTSRNSNNSSTTGRKFYFNPTRSRVNDFVSSSPFIKSHLKNTVSTPTPYAPYSHSYDESVKSPVNMRSHHSRSEMQNLPPLEFQDRTRSHSQRKAMSQNHHHRQQLKYCNALSAFADHNSSMPMQNVVYSHDTTTLTPYSSNTSLSSKSSDVENCQTFKSSNLDVRLQPKIQPPVKNTSSFLTTPRSSPFGLTKSYTDLYFSTNCKEKKPKTLPDKSQFKERKSLQVPIHCKKHCIK